MQAAKLRRRREAGEGGGGGGEGFEGAQGSNGRVFAEGTVRKGMPDIVHADNSMCACSTSSSSSSNTVAGLLPT